MSNNFDVNLLKAIAETHEINLRTKGYSITADGIPYTVDANTGQAKMVQIKDLSNITQPTSAFSVPTVYKPPTPVFHFQTDLMGHPMGLFGQLSKASFGVSPSAQMRQQREFTFGPGTPCPRVNLIGHPGGFFGKVTQDAMKAEEENAKRYITYKPPEGRGPLEFCVDLAPTPKRCEGECQDSRNISNLYDADSKAYKDFKKQTASMEVLMSQRTLHKLYGQKYDLPTRRTNQISPDGLADQVKLNFESVNGKANPNSTMSYYWSQYY